MVGSEQMVFALLALLALLGNDELVNCGTINKSRGIYL